MGCPWEALNIDLLDRKYIPEKPEGHFLSLSQVFWCTSRLLVLKINKAKLELEKSSEASLTVVSDSACF